MENQKNQLLDILIKHEKLFQGKRGVWNSPDVTIHLKKDQSHI